MLKGFDKNGNMRDVLVTENGEVAVSLGGNSSSDGKEPSIVTSSKETTLYSAVVTLSTTEQTIGLANKVTEISIANYSETANAIVSVDGTDFVIAPNLAVDLPINKTVSLVGLSATENDTQIQYVIKGEE